MPKNCDYIAEPLRQFAVKVATLSLDEANARAHDEASIDAIKDSLTRFKQRTPVIVQKATMKVVKGNGTCIAAERMGWKYVAALVLDDTDAIATAYALADNRTAEMSDWDGGALEQALASLRRQTGASLEDLGFANFPFEDYAIDADALNAIAQELRDSIEEEPLEDHDFTPGEDDQPRLDELKPKHECPNCGHKW